MDVSLSELWELVMDREAWHAVIHGVPKSRTRLSDWTDWLTKSIVILPPCLFCTGVQELERVSLCPWYSENSPLYVLILVYFYSLWEAVSGPSQSWYVPHYQTVSCIISLMVSPFLSILSIWNTYDLLLDFQDWCTTCLFSPTFHLFVFISFPQSRRLLQF